VHKRGLGAWTVAFKQQDQAATRPRENEVREPKANDATQRNH